MPQQEAVGGVNKELLELGQWITHLFIDDVHQVHICQHSQCVENRQFEQRLREDGSYEVSRKVMKRPLYRKFDSRNPYDATTKAKPLDDIQWLLGDEAGHVETLVADENTAAFKATLTKLQLNILELLEQGYMPRDIADMWGRKDSGSIRYHKHIIKRKAEEWWGR